MKTISFAVPCYNSADYMENCVKSLLPCGEDIEIILVDDGSTKDDTPAICDRLQAEHPGIIRAIHKENGGHGSAVNAGLAAAEGLYFKVVDSDDWLDKDAMDVIMPYLRQQKARLEHTGDIVSTPTDMIIGNYVYEKVHEGTHTTMRYTNVFPTDKEFGWSEVGHFRQSQYLLMHSVIYRTALLRDMDLKLPEHCFYVDNIFVYVPLPHVKTMRYFNVDMYRYFIGREDQSVNEQVMLSRIDQQLRVTKVMIDSVVLADVANKKLRSYMRNYLSMMMCICSIFLRMDPTPENEAKRADIWAYLRAKDEGLYSDLRHTLLNMTTNLPTSAGRKLGLTGYHLAQKIFKFN
ncbi:MAG: glycosyltransferase family 2 protein [Eggerthellaceae bacterium]